MTKRLRIAVAFLSITASGLALIQGEEGSGPQKLAPSGEVVSQAYPDPALGWKVPTICDGHTRGVFRGQVASPAECQRWLIEDTSESGRAIKRCTPVAMTQGQYNALVSFVHNVGGTTYCASKLARNLNGNHCLAAAIEFNAAPQIDRVTGSPRLWHGAPIRDRATHKILLSTGGPVMKFTTSGGIPLPGLIMRRARERSLFEADCDLW